MPSAADLTPDRLIGRWNLHRRLRDGGVSTVGRVCGTLDLRPEGPGLRWDESGFLHWNGRVIEVTRTYLLREGSAGWWVHFADGRPFHPWTPGVPVAHPCAADLYRGLVRIDSPDRWRVVWDVTGPRKQQRIVTRLTRNEQV